MAIGGHDVLCRMHCGGVVGHGVEDWLLRWLQLVVVHVVLSRIRLGHVDWSWLMMIGYHGWLLGHVHGLLGVMMGWSTGVVVVKLVPLVLLRRCSRRHHDLLMRWILRHWGALLVHVIHHTGLLGCVLGCVLVVHRLI